LSEDKAEAGEKDFFAIGLGDDVAFVPTDIFARYVKSKTPKNQDGIFTKNNTFNVEGGAEIRLPNNNTIRFEGRVRRTKGKVLFPEKLQNKYGLPPEETFKDRGTNVGAFYSKQNKDENIGGSVGLNYDAEAGKFREFNASGFLRNIFGNDSLKASASFNPTNKKASGKLEYTSKFNDGGLTMNKQMELFEEGGEVDPVSGNDVPLGSTEKEVRDDQPAMLSEGEMVVPADVVRYFGVEHFMKLRDEAKMGYKKMEAMGQFGTDEGKTLPDDTLFNAGGPPFTIEDIEVIEPDDLESLEGGEEDTLEANAGAFVQGGQGTNPFDNNAATTAGQQFASGKPITASSFSQPAFTFDSFKGFSGLTSDYIQSFLPDAFKNKKPEQASLATNILDTFYGNKLPQQAQGASTKSGQSDVPDGGGTSDLSSATPGIGSVSELAGNASTASVNSLAGLGQMLDTPVGRGVLDAVGYATSFAMTPSTGIVSGLMRGASALSPTISKGFRDLQDIGRIDAARAANAALAMKAEFAALSPAEIADINTLAAFNSISNVTGYDPTVDPAVSAVGVTSMGVPGYSVAGPLGATYGWNNDFGWEVVADPLSTKDLDKAKQKQDSINQIGTEAAAVGAVDVDPSGSEGLAGPPGGQNEPSPNQSPSPSFGDQEYGGGPDQDDGPEADGGAVGGTDNDADGDDTGGPDGEGEGEDGGPEGIAKGGLIKRKPRNKKRGGRKRKKRGGLGSR